MKYKAYLGILAVAISFCGYVPYFFGIYTERVKPHAFSWAVWTITSAVTFAAQMNAGAGAGAWVMGFLTLVCFTIFVIALFHGSRSFHTLDYISLVGALIAILLWWATDDPSWSVILVTLIDTFAFVPTFRKSLVSPYDEALVMYLLSATKFLVVLFALESYSFVTVLYPAWLLPLNLAFVLLVLYKRYRMKKLR